MCPFSREYRKMYGKRVDKKPMHYTFPRLGHSG